MDWRRARPLLERLLEVPEAERDAALARECRDDEELRGELALLLAAGRSRRGWLGPRSEDARLPRSPAAGDRIGSWRLLELLGEGGMGRVWSAERADADFRQRAALKLVKPGMDTDEVLRRFRRERQLLAELEHPGIVRLLDGGETDAGRPYLVMEHVDGEPILRHCATRRLDLRARLELFGDVCAAVAFAHERGAVHCDLKPANVLVDARGAPKLLDFGIAKILAGEPGRDGAEATHTGQRFLSPWYASPEQVRGEPTGTPADVYALGALLCELLTGERPRREPALSPAQPIRRDHDFRCRRPSELAGSRALRRRLRGDLDWIVGTALREEPERRYPDAGALLQDLRRHLAGERVLARPDGLAYRVRSFARRNRALVGSALSVFVILLAALAITTRLWRDSVRSEAAARATSYSAHLQSAEASLRDGAVSVARAQLEAAPQEHRGWEWRHLRGRLDRSSETFVATYEHGSAEFMTHSPDGRLLAIAVGPRIDLRDARTGAARVTRILEEFELPDGGSSLAGQVDFRPDGEELAVAGCDGRLRIFDTTELALRHELELDGSPCTGAAYDPTGRWLACATWSGRIRLYRLPELAPVAEVQAHADRGPAVTLKFHPAGKLLASRGWDRRLRLWSVPELELVRDLVGHEKDVVDVEFLPDGERLVSASMDGTLRVWRVEDGRTELVFRGHRGPVYAVAVDPLRGSVASGDLLGNLLRWDPRSGTELARLGGHEEGVLGIEYSPDGRRLASADVAHRVKLWDPGTGDVPTRSVEHHSRVLLASPSGDELALVQPDGAVGRWSLPALEPLPAFELGVDPCWGARWISGRGIVFALESGVVGSLELPSGAIRELRSGLGTITAFHCGPAGERALAVVTREGVSVPVLIDLTGDVPARALTCPGCPSWSRRRRPGLADLPDGRFALVDDQAHLLLVDPWSESVELAAALPLPPQSAFALACDPDGRRAYVGHATGVLAWELADRAPSWSSEEVGRVASLALHPSEERLLVGTGTGTIAVLERRRGRTLVRLAGHAGAVDGLEWAVGTETLLSTSVDGSLKAWGAAPAGAPSAR